MVEPKSDQQSGVFKKLSLKSDPSINSGFSHNEESKERHHSSSDLDEKNRREGSPKNSRSVQPCSITIADGSHSDVCDFDVNRLKLSDVGDQKDFQLRGEPREYADENETYSDENLVSVSAIQGVV